MNSENSIRLNSVKTDNDKNPETIYGYAGLGVLVLGILCGFLLVWFIWEIATSNISVAKLIILGLCYIVMLSVCLRGLIRLWEKVIVTNSGIKRVTPFGVTEISWSDIKSIRLYMSLFERYCYRIDSITGKSFSINQSLVGYVEVYELLKTKSSPDKFIQTSIVHDLKLPKN